MTKTRSTKRALFLSAMSLLLCAAMLIGTTYAWFTESVSSVNNIITGGNLDVELWYKTVDPTDPTKTTEWAEVDANTNVFTDALWEPGHTQVVYLKVANAGTLSLKYQLGVNVASELAGINEAGEIFRLSDYVEFAVIDGEKTGDRATLRGEAANAGAKKLREGYSKSNKLFPVGEGTSEEIVTMVVYMPETVGNEANHKTGTVAPTLNLGINLIASQYTWESDSFGPDYDETAPWTGAVDTAWYNTTDDTFTLTTAEELAGLAQIVNAGTDTFKGKTVTLAANVDLNNVNWTPIGSGSNRFEGSFIATGYTIYNLRVVGQKALGLFGKTFTGAHIEGVTIDGAYVSGNDYVGAVLGQGYLGHNCIVSCTVIDATIIATPYFDNEKGVYDGGAKAGVIAGQAYNGNITDCTATSSDPEKPSTVIAYRDLGGIAGMLDFDGKAGTTVEASGNTVENVVLSYVGVAGNYDGDKPNENMGAIVGRVGANAVVPEGANTATNVIMNEANKGATMIFTLEELIAFAKAVNSGNTYAGKTVLLGADIDLLNMDWTPIGNSTNKFQGTFDGQGYTISNLKITGNKSNVGLFGYTTNGEIKNLTVENANVTGYLNVGVVAGTPYTSKYSNITVKGHVEVNGFAYVGGVGGKNAYADWTGVTVNVDESSYVKANSVENGTAYRTYVGGVVGFNGEGGHTFKNITSNIDVIGSTCDVGGAFGIAHYGNNFENVTVTGNVTITNAAEAADAEEMGGIAGVWHNGGSPVTFNGCKFTGTLSANITEGVDLSDNTITGKAYSASGAGVLIIDGKDPEGNWAVLDEADLKDAIAKGGEVKLYDDVPATATMTIPAGVTAVLNLNGKEITAGYQEGSTTKHIYPISNSGDLTIEGGSISGRGIYNQDGAKLTVNGATINALDYNGGACVWSYGAGEVYLNDATLIGNTGCVSSEGYVEINGGTYTCYSGIAEDGTQKTAPTYNIRAYDGLKITGGTFTSRHGVISIGGGECVIEDGDYTIQFAAATTSNVVYAYGNANLTINGGDFISDNTSGKADSGAAVLVSGSNAKAVINNGTFVGMNGMVSGNATLYGGTYNTVWNYNHYDKLESLIADGCTAIQNTDGSWTVAPEKYTTSVASGVVSDADAEGKVTTYGVTNANGLAWVEEQADDYFAGKTIKLEGDIDCGGETIDAIRVWNPENRTVVDGQGHTISNLVITNTSGNAGLFDGTFDIKNVNVEDATVTGKYAGVLAGNMYGNIDNCNVKNVTINGSYWQTGILVGQYNSGNITNCTIEGCVINGKAAVGALVGILNETPGVRKIENCTIKNCEINQTGSFGGDYDDMFGVAVGLINIANSEVYFTNCTVEGNTVKGVASDALYGVVESGTTVTVN